MIRRCCNFLLKILKTPWVQGLICALLLVLVLWVAGPLVAVAGHVFFESTTSRLVGTLVIVFIWGLMVAILSSRQRRREAADPEIATRKEKDAALQDRLREEFRHIRHTIKTAIKTVTTSNFYGPTSRSRYALPWYMVLGSENCGKTSLLLNSGLQFPLNEQADRHLYKLKSTSKIEVLFANQAVFIDTPGFYAQCNQESREHGLWNYLLRCLFRERPAKALNGIIVCVSMRDMLDGDTTRREHLARTIRTRLGEVLKNLRSYTPVYLVFTKCDAVPGFAQFFAHLSRNEREQIFGCPARASVMDLDATRQEFHELMQTLNAQIITKIHQERDCLARARMFRFPQELAALGSRIQDLIFEAFGPSRYHRPVMFRGFFFSSALSSSDVMPGAAREGELAYQSGFQSFLGDYAKGFFLLRLLEGFVIPEAGLADADREHIWMLRFRRFGTQLAAGIVLIAGVSLLAFSFKDNFRRMELLEVMSNDFKREQQMHLEAGDALKILPELAPLEKALTVYDRHQDPFLSRRLGLYQGDVFEGATRRAYTGVLNARLLPRVREMAVNTMGESVDDLGALKSALRAYLMLCQPDKLSERFLKEWLERRWAELYPGGVADQRTLMRHISFLIEEGISPVSPDEQTLAKARTALLKKPLSHLAYQQMKEEASEGGNSPFTFHGVFGGRIAAFSGDTYAIPYLYTLEGFHEYIMERCPEIIQELTEDSWVFGPKSMLFSALDVEKISKDVRVLYFKDYARHWNQALQELRVFTPRSMIGAADLAEQLGSGVSPVVLMLRELRKNTTFVAREKQEGGLESAVEQQAAKRGTRKLTGVAGTALAKAATESVWDVVAQARTKVAREALRDAQLVTQSFKHLDSLLDAEGNPAPALKGVHDAMRDAGLLFRKINDSNNRNKQLLAALQDIAEDRDGTLHSLSSAAERLPAPVRKWYSTVSTGGLKQMLAEAASIIDFVYHDSVLSVYNAGLKDLYPLRIDSDLDANLVEFANFFKKAGIFDVFHDTYIRPFVSKNGEIRPVLGCSLPISKESIDQLQRVRKIQDAFFVSANDLGISFLIEPYALDVKLKQVEISHGNKMLSYWHGPVQSANFVWPLDAGQSPEASLAMTDVHAVRVFKDMRGDWAFFRLLQNGKVKLLEGNKCIVELYENGKWAQFLVQFRNKANPFDPEVCSFSLPETLF